LTTPTNNTVVVVIVVVVAAAVVDVQMIIHQNKLSLNNTPTCSSNTESESAENARNKARVTEAITVGVSM